MKEIVDSDKKVMPLLPKRSNGAVQEFCSMLFSLGFRIDFGARADLRLVPPVPFCTKATLAARVRQAHWAARDFLDAWQGRN